MKRQDQTPSTDAQQDQQRGQHVSGSLHVPAVPAPTLCRFWTVGEAVAAGVVEAVI